jgi:hypothetical protein
MKYAIETLEIEKSRLIRAIREMRSLPVLGDDYPSTRIDEHKKSLEELEDAISTIKGEIANRQRKFELEIERGKEAMRKHKSSRSDSSSEANPENQSG